MGGRETLSGHSQVAAFQPFLIEIFMALDPFLLCSRFNLGNTSFTVAAIIQLLHCALQKFNLSNMDFLSSFLFYIHIKSISFKTHTLECVTYYYSEYILLYIFK